MFLVTYEGDIECGKQTWRMNGQKHDKEPWVAQNRVFNTVDDALAAIAQDFPMEWDEREKRERRVTPDPEDDRIVIWELVVGETMKSVAHFSGWHWSWDEMGGAKELILPGDTKSLYAIAMEDM